MAKLRFSELSDIDFTKNATVKVGHNRTVTKVSETYVDVFSFRLYGHEIAKLIVDHGGAGITLSLNHQGYMTTTTRSAMYDAIRLFGLFGNISFARNEFTAGVQLSYTGEPLVWQRGAVHEYWFEFAAGHALPFTVCKY